MISHTVHCTLKSVDATFAFYFIKKAFIHIKTRKYDLLMHTIISLASAYTYAGTSQLSGKTGKNPLPHHEAYVKTALALNSLQISCSNFPKISFGKLKAILTPILGCGNCHKSSMLILIKKVSKSGEIFQSTFAWFLEQSLHHFKAGEQFWTLFDLYSMKL